MAEKIVLELKDKDFVKAYYPETSQKSWQLEQISLPATVLDNIKSTLQNMGYQGRDIERILLTLPDDYDSIELILPYMIRELS